MQLGVSSLTARVDVKRCVVVVGGFVVVVVGSFVVVDLLIA